MRNEIKFRYWLESAEQEDQSIQSMIDGNDFVLFFTKDNQIFAASEDGRLTFARMKHPDEEDADWMKEASFGAVNLNQALEGRRSENIFNMVDLKKIKIIDRNKAIQMLNKVAKSIPAGKRSIKQNLTLGGEEDPQVPSNMGKIGEK
jgi:hypothetical protein